MCEDLLDFSIYTELWVVYGEGFKIRFVNSEIVYVVNSEMLGWQELIYVFGMW